MSNNYIEIPNFGYKNEYLANAIFIFHCIIVLFILLVPFFNIPALLIVHIVFSICLFIHWINNSNVCSLTILEAQLRGLNRTETFSHQFISPIYDISSTEWSNIVWIITFVVMCISIYNLYNSDKFKIAMNNYYSIDSNLPFSEKLNQIACVFLPLFVL